MVGGVGDYDDRRRVLGRSNVVVVGDDGGGVARSADVVAATAAANAENDPGPDVGHEDNIGGAFRAVVVAAASTQVVARVAAGAPTVGRARVAAGTTEVA